MVENRDATCMAVHSGMFAVSKDVAYGSPRVSPFRECWLLLLEAVKASSGPQTAQPGLAPNHKHPEA